MGASEYKPLSFFSPINLNERVEVPVPGGTLTFEKDQVPADLLTAPDKYQLLEKITGDSPWKKAEYRFVAKEPTPAGR